MCSVDVNVCEALLGSGVCSSGVCVRVSVFADMCVTEAK